MTKKVLIVEDEYVVAGHLRLVLTKAGYHVTGIAVSVEEAEEHLQKLKPDLVILDIRLDGKLSGIDLARRLSAQHVAFIYLSAHSSQDILAEANKTEPYGFLVKPFREKDLLVTLDIAWYRQKNDLEARLLQETLLQKRLLEISNEQSGSKQKFLNIARAIRVFIPFDLIVSGTAVSERGENNTSGYLRVGFDEYQYIIESELMTNTGLHKKSANDVIQDSRLLDAAEIFGAGMSINEQPMPGLQQAWMEIFKMESCLGFPVELGEGILFHYFFYSRQRETYTQKHVAVLNLFTRCLTNVTEKRFQQNTSTSEVWRSAESLFPQDLERSEFAGIIGKHPLLLEALDLTIQVAPYNTSVLILGESGTGKEKIAKSIHLLSNRKNRPFVQVNCGAIPNTLIESELFGHEKGAFTGATEKRKGRFEQASGGTIFLDEIGELPLDMQVKLLRVLQEKEITSIGSNSAQKVDLRVVAATNKNLEKEVAEGRFRLDLFYRLNVFPITVVPLRERKSDIKALVIFFAEKFCKEFKREFRGIDPSMLEQMQNYHWPGNIRELENILERCVILNDGKTMLQWKQNLGETTLGKAPMAGIQTLDDVKQLQQETEKAYLISILIKTNGRIRGQNGAAELLKVKPTTLESKIAKMGIERKDYMQ